jgi:cell division protein FtsB
VKKDSQIKGEGLKKRYILFIVMLGVALLAVFGDRGLIDLYRLAQERDGIVDYIAVLDEKNTELKRQTELLKTDERYIELIAKKELGMIGRNEVIYKIQ